MMKCPSCGSSMELAIRKDCTPERIIYPGNYYCPKCFYVGRGKPDDEKERRSQEEQSKSSLSVPIVLALMILIWVNMMKVMHQNTAQLLYTTTSLYNKVPESHSPGVFQKSAPIFGIGGFLDPPRGGSAMWQASDAVLEAVAGFGRQLRGMVVFYLCVAMYI